MVDPVEGRCQVGIEHPPAAGVGTPGHFVDRLDCVVTTAAGPEAIRLRLEPCLPLGFQRIDDQGLQCPIDDDRDTERALFPVGLGMYTRLTGWGSQDPE